MKSAALTPRQEDALAAIRVFHAANGYMPTMRDLAAELGVTKTAASSLLDGLERRGVIERVPGIARGIRFPPTDDAAARRSR